jgi:hypothetical protein
LRSSSTTMLATDAGLSSDIANTARLRGCALRRENAVREHGTLGPTGGSGFGLDPGGCEVVDSAGPSACACGTRLTLLELVWWVRVAHCAWLPLCPLPILMETPIARYLVRNPRYYLSMPFTHGGTEYDCNRPSDRYFQNWRRR